MPSEQDNPGYDSLNPNALWHDVGKINKTRKSKLSLKIYVL